MESKDAVNQARRILLVEDDKDIQDSMSELLVLEGFEVTTANNGLDGLRLLERAAELPALILLDLMMPTMDGVEFRRRQAAHPRLSKIPVIVLSADTRPEDRFPKEDTALVLRKPVDIDKLLETIRMAIASRV